MQKEFGRTLPFLRGTGKALKEMSVFFAHNRSMNGYSSWQCSCTSSPRISILVETQSGVLFRIFSCFSRMCLPCIFDSFCCYFSWIGFLCFLASHRIALLFRISLRIGSISLLRMSSPFSSLILGRSLIDGVCSCPYCTFLYESVPFLAMSLQSRMVYLICRTLSRFSCFPVLVLRV